MGCPINQYISKKYPAIRYENSSQSSHWDGGGNHPGGYMPNPWSPAIMPHNRPVGAVGGHPGKCPWGLPMGTNPPPMPG